jgi:pyruvate dehydrogenase E1 component alpha subunit
MALNPDYYRLFAEVLGKQTGFSRGMGGSMHLWDQPSGFYGCVPIVSGTVALAVGAGMAAKLQNLDDIGVVYLGDGAIEEGVVHESLNLARMQKAPVLFVLENNLFASHMHVSLRQPSDLMTRFAVANDIPNRLVEGNNVVAVAEATAELVNNSRQGNGPGFLEVVTYRWYGHVDWREDIDVGVNRSLEDVDNWRARDPISRLSAAMIESGMWSQEQESSLSNDLDSEILAAWDKAMEDPYPDDSATMDMVYANRDE